MMRSRKCCHVLGPLSSIIERFISDPILVMGPGTNKMEAVKAVLGSDSTIVKIDQLEQLPSSRGRLGGLQRHVAGGRPIILEDVDRIQRHDVLVEVHHLLTTASRPIVATATSEQKVPVEIMSLFGYVTYA